MRKKILLFSVSAISLLADPLSTYIGTKAKGMGGAFTAVSNNNAALYFNPAGLTTFDGRNYALTTLEYGSGAKIDESAGTGYDQLTTGTQFFFSMAQMSPKNGFAFGIFNLYDLTLQGKDGNLYTENVMAYTISMALKILGNFYTYGGQFSIGGTIGGALSPNQSEYATVDSEGKISVAGWMPIVGVKFRALQLDFFSVDFGLNYRSATTLDDSDANNAATMVGFGIPEELALGAAMAYGTEFGLITLSYDYKQSAFSAVTGPLNTSFNLLIEDAITQNIGLELATNSFQIRGGYYTSTTAANQLNYGSGYSAGIGYNFASNESSIWNLEASYDHRTFDFINGAEPKSNDYISLSINWGKINGFF